MNIFRRWISLAPLVGVLTACLPAGTAAPPDPITERRARRRDAALFVQAGCHDCHAVSALGLKASADVGPDLTYAYGDVVIRYGVNLETFLAHPTGIMRLMLGAHLDLTVAEREAIVRVLRRLHVEHQAEFDEPPLLRPRGGQGSPGQ
jgi:mono/diheme cytochrome c family protein